MDWFFRKERKLKKVSVTFNNVYEELSCQYLIDRGLELLKTNYRCKMGEIDLVFKDKQQLVFVEVRYRKHSLFGGAAASVSPSKQRKVILAATHFLQNNELNIHPNTACRFDVMCVSPNLSPNHSEANDLQFDWLRDAFCSSGQR